MCEISIVEMIKKSNKKNVDEEVLFRLTSFYFKKKFYFFPFTVQHIVLNIIDEYCSNIRRQFLRILKVKFPHQFHRFFFIWRNFMFQFIRKQPNSFSSFYGDVNLRI